MAVFFAIVTTLEVMLLLAAGSIKELADSLIHIVILGIHGCFSCCWIASLRRASTAEIVFITCSCFGRGIRAKTDSASYHRLLTTAIHQAKQ